MDLKKEDYIGEKKYRDKKRGMKCYLFYAGDVIYFISNHLLLGISPSVLLSIDRLKSHCEN